MSRHERSISQSEYACVIENLRGLSTERGGDIEYTENMYVNRSSGDGALESFPGVRELCNLGSYINGIYLHHSLIGEHHAVINTFGEIYRVPLYDLQYFETPEAPIGVTDTPELTSAQLGGTLYLKDAACIYEVKDDGGFQRHSEEILDGNYIPTTFADGVRVEHRNLLSPYFYETRKIELPDDYSYGSPDLIYSIIDKEKKECAVTGIGNEHEETVYIPRFKTIGGVRYTVTEIATNAFYDTADVTRIITNRGLKRVGVAAFMEMTSLQDIVLSDTVEELGDYCFFGCEELSHIHVGAGFKKFGKAVFTSCGDFTVDFEGSSEMLDDIENVGALAGAHINYYAQFPEITLLIPVKTEAEDIIALHVSGDSYSPDLFEHGVGVRLTLENRMQVADKTVTIRGIHSDTGGVISYSTCSDFTPARLIYDCRICHTYDGRIFYAANPYFPELVFYSTATMNGEINPFYVSDQSYFTIDLHAQEIMAMSTAGQSLAVFTTMGSDSSSIFFIKPRGEGKNAGYEVVSSYGGSEINAAVNHLGETFCYSSLGVARFRGSVGRCTDFEIISSPISHLLAGRYQYEIRLGAFDRYLVVAHGTDMFLCDLTKRLDYGKSEAYEWYPLKDIGSYSGDSPLYVFADEPYGEYEVNEPFVGHPARGTVYTVQLDDDAYVCYVKNGQKKYRVYETQFREFGYFSTPTAFLGVSDLLFYGTDCGSFCVFNTDMRGMPPPFVEADPDFDFSEYEEAYGDKIHPYYYTIQGHARNYKVVTRTEDCSKPYLLKSTVRNSMIVDMKSFPGSRASCAAVYNGDKRVELGTVTASGLNFDEFNFGDVELLSKPSTKTQFSGGEVDWRTMKLELYSKESFYPFALRSICYRYTLSDKTKKSII